MGQPDILVMVCPRCRERFNVLREWAASVRCPGCDGVLNATQDAIVPPDAGDPIGKDVGGCRILELIGRGKAGSVYRGTHLGLQRDVAVKIVPITETNRPLLKRLIFEARTLAKIEHPNIVQVYDVGLQSPFFFIVMQLLRGPTLSAYLLDHVADLETAVSFVRQIAQGLQAAHTKGVVHRDLKPDNVIVVDRTAKITDFGLAKHLGSLDDLSQMVVGTPFYMPPEQWTRGRIDARSDLYSLGVIFYLMLCGRKPFEPNSMGELMRQHLSEMPPPPRKVNQNVPEPLSCVVLKLLAKDPQKRYASAQDLLDDLNRYQRGEELLAAHAFKKWIKCSLCDTLNPPNLTQCRICGERLGSSKFQLNLQLREGEVNCPSCARVVQRGRHACPYCGIAICIKCHTRIAEVGPRCVFCASSGH